MKSDQFNGLTTYEIDQLSLAAAQAICQRGYRPEQAVKIVKMSYYVRQQLDAWYDDWTDDIRKQLATG